MDRKHITVNERGIIGLWEYLWKRVLAMGSINDKVFAGRLDDLPVIPVPDHAGTEKRVVFCPGRFWEGYVMRYFTTKAGKKTPFHSHDWPHYVVVLEGSARALIVGKTWDLTAGSWAYVPADT